MSNPAHKEKSEFPEVHSSHMKLLLECMSTCAACAKKCIEEGHKKTAVLCTDCSEICSLAIKSASSHSEFAPEVMDLCVTACKRCGEECKKMPPKHCQECADICKRCATACSSMR